MPYLEDLDADTGVGKVVFTTPYYDIAGLLREIANYIENYVDAVTDLEIKLAYPTDHTNTGILYVAERDEE